MLHALSFFFLSAFDVLYTRPQAFLPVLNKVCRAINVPKMQQLKDSVIFV